MSQLEDDLARLAAANENKAKETKRMWISIAILVGVIALVSGIAGLADGSMELGCNSDPDPVEECTNRGIAYFKDIGSYPRLSNGADAETEARERCNRTTTAFPK